MQTMHQLQFSLWNYGIFTMKQKWKFSGQGLSLVPDKLKLRSLNQKQLASTYAKIYTYCFVTEGTE